MIRPRDLMWGRAGRNLPCSGIRNAKTYLMKMESYFDQVRKYWADVLDREKYIKSIYAMAEVPRA